MALENGEPLKLLATRFSAGAPITLKDLKALGVSSQLAYWYTKNGWLQRLGRGAFVRDVDQLDLKASLVALERAGGPFHVGGRTALDWRGIRHFVRDREAITLFGSHPFKVPEWLTDHFNVLYRRKQLFSGKDAKSFAVSPLERAPPAPLVSEPERAILELLSEVPQRQSVEEARLLMEGMQTLRPPVLQRLLASCASVKTVRLFLSLSRDLGLPHLSKLDERKFRKGSKSRYIYRTAHSTLVLKP